MFRVLGSGRFALFLVVSSGFYFIYNQVYNVLPLYVKKTVELSPAMDLYTMANPITIVLFQLLITRLFGKLPPIKSIIIGTVIIGLSMLINVAPLFMAGGVTMKLWLPMGSLFVVLTVALIAFGELFAASRLYDYIGSLAPKGQEGLFLGYANLPMAIGSLVGGPAGAWLFNKVMCAGAVKQADGLLKLDPKAAATGWIILTLFGLGSALSLWFYNRWLQEAGLISDKTRFVEDNGPPLPRSPCPRRKRRCSPCAKGSTRGRRTWTFRPAPSRRSTPGRASTGAPATSTAFIRSRTGRASKVRCGPTATI